MVVGFVNAGLMNLAQAAGIIMGANIGTTITAQLVAFKLTDIAPLFVFGGAMIVMFAKMKKKKEIGNIILGFGILFIGMGMMSESMEPLRESAMFQKVLLTISDKWYLGVIAGALITAVLQSSSATTGILVALANAGAISIAGALPIVLGCNIGTCITAMLSTVGTNKTAHRAAMMHLIFNVTGTVIFLPLLATGLLADIVSYMSPVVSKQIANAHTIFNITNTIIMVPLIPLLIKVVTWIIPGEDEDEKQGPKYIDDRLLETPVIAAGQVIKETIRMATKAKKGLVLSMDAFKKNDESLVQKVYEIINILEESITTYLVKLSKCELSDKEKNIVAATFHIVNDIERIGDHAENLADLTLQKINKSLEYSKDAMEELDSIYSSTLEALDIAIESYENRNVNKAKSIVDVEAKIDKKQKSFRERHIRRLYDGRCNAYTGAIFLDILSNLERIGDHSTNIAESVIENN